MVDIRNLGVGRELVPYAEALALQRSTHASLPAGDGRGTVLLLEHSSVYTAGRRTDPSERPSDGTPVIDVDRGGKITWHGPGQLVGYPIVRLPEPIDVVQYVRDLESVLIAVLFDLGVDARRVAGRSGAWVGEPGAEAKIAAIGIRVEGGVALHGFALNCSNSLEPYARIVACGIRDAGVTTVTEVVGREVTPAEALPFVEERLTQLFERWVDDRAAAERLAGDRAAGVRAADARVVAARTAGAAGVAA